MTTPIYMAPADASFVPHKYVIYTHSQHCDACGSIHKWSDVYGEQMLKARLGGGGYIKNRRLIERMIDVRYNLPVEIIPQQRNIPFCHNCLRPGMLHHKPHISPLAPDPRNDLVSMQIVQRAPTRTRWQDKHGNWHVEDLDPAATPQIKTARPKASKKFTVDNL